MGLPPSHIEGSSTSVGRTGYSYSPVVVVKNVDDRKPIVLGISPGGVHASYLWSSSGSNQIKSSLFIHHIFNKIQGCLQYKTIYVIIKLS